MIKKSYITPFFIAITGYVCMVSMDTSIKILGNNYPIYQLLFLNAIFSLIPISFFVLKFHGISFYKKQKTLTLKGKGFFSLLYLFRHKSLANYRYSLANKAYHPT